MISTAIPMMNMPKVTWAPNPFTDRLSLNMGIIDNYRIRLLGTDGRRAYDHQVYDQQTVIDASALPAGLYLLEVIGEKNSYFSKVVKQ